MRAGWASNVEEDFPQSKYRFASVKLTRTDHSLPKSSSPPSPHTAFNVQRSAFNPSVHFDEAGHNSHLFIQCFLRCANMLLLDKARQTRFKMGTDKFLVAFRVVHSPRNHVILFAGTFLVA